LIGCACADRAAVPSGRSAPAYRWDRRGRRAL